MCITRHFYPKEGVGEALLLSLGISRDPLRKQKALFWTYELLLSEEEEYLWTVLGKAVERYGSSQEDTLLKTQQLLPLLTSLLSIPWPQPYGPPIPSPVQIPKELPEVPSAWTVEQRARLWWAVQDAKDHQRGERLLRLLGSLHLSIVSLYLQTPKAGWRRMLEAVGCPWNPVARPGTSVQFPTLQQGRLSARLFALPKSCLSRTPLHQAGWDVWRGCSFWRTVLKTYGALESGKFSTVEQEETFYSTYFPDDLPDEWSSAERAKSHLNM